jgi:hypothetical protein
VPGEVSGQAPADVFALGLVLLSVCSALEGWRPEDTENFPSIGSVSPFYENMPSVVSWIEDRVEERVQIPPQSARSDLSRKWDLILLRLFSRMVAIEPSGRLRMSEVVTILRTLSIQASFCSTCQELLSEDELEGVDMAWVIGVTEQSLTDGHDGQEEVQSDGSFQPEIIHDKRAGSLQSDDAEEWAVRDEESTSAPLHTDLSIDSGSTIPLEAEKQIETKEDETASPETRTNHSHGASPPIQTQEPAPKLTSAPTSRDQRIIFVDCYGRRYPCPYRSVNTWEVGLRQ